MKAEALATYLLGEVGPKAREGCLSRMSVSLWETSCCVLKEQGGRRPTRRAKRVTSPSHVVGKKLPVRPFLCLPLVADLKVAGGLDL